MLKAFELMDSLERGKGKISLGKLYGNQERLDARKQEMIFRLVNHFEDSFGKDRGVLCVSAPGRSELGGNHTDHENGRVLAAAIDLDMVGIASPNEEKTIRILSEGYEAIRISIDDLEPRPEERNTSAACVRGICHFLSNQHAMIGGFDGVLSSDIPSGSGLSSSASFEIFVAQVMNNLYNSGSIPGLMLAQAGQHAEVDYFNKPSGLMDQLVVATGGMMSIDFRDPMHPEVKKVQNTLEDNGFALVITNTGGSHSNLTEEYASITIENKAVAGYFGRGTLREVNEAEFNSTLPSLRKKVGDRAVLRAMHFFSENQRVLAQVEALEKGDITGFLDLVNESGRSSWMLLQNCYSCSRPTIQDIAIGLARSAQLLRNSGAWRVHGGGFAGTIQAFLPESMLPEYALEMVRIFGQGNCRRVRIRQAGAIRLEV